MYDRGHRSWPTVIVTAVSSAWQKSFDLLLTYSIRPVPFRSTAHKKTQIIGDRTSGRLGNKKKKERHAVLHPELPAVDADPRLEKMTTEWKRTNTHTHGQLTILTLHLVTCCTRSSSALACMMAGGAPPDLVRGDHKNCDGPAGSRLRAGPMRNVLLEVCFGRAPSRTSRRHSGTAPRRLRGGGRALVPGINGSGATEADRAESATGERRSVN